jgi:hypothetical protein
MQRLDSAIWHGTLIEQLDLMAAVQHHCECTYSMRELAGVCAGHVMLARDQRAVDGLLWSRRLVRQLLAEEGVVAP